MTELTVYEFIGEVYEGIPLYVTIGVPALIIGARLVEKLVRDVDNLIDDRNRHHEDNILEDLIKTD